MYAGDWDLEWRGKTDSYREGKVFFLPGLAEYKANRSWEVLCEDTVVATL